MTIEVRRRAGRRISGVLWGLLVMGTGALMIASFSGYEVDLELAGIILLAGLGGWLLLSAAVSGIGRKREIAAATAPTVEESAEAPAEEAAAEESVAAEVSAAVESDDVESDDVESDDENTEKSQ